MFKEGSFGPVHYQISYNKHFALLRVRNIFTEYDETKLVDFSFFSMDKDLMNSAVDIAIQDMGEESFCRDKE